MTDIRTPNFLEVRTMMDSKQNTPLDRRRKSTSQPNIKERVKSALGVSTLDPVFPTTRITILPPQTAMPTGPRRRSVWTGDNLSPGTIATGRRYSTALPSSRRRSSASMPMTPGAQDRRSSMTPLLDSRRRKNSSPSTPMTPGTYDRRSSMTPLLDSRRRKNSSPSTPMTPGTHDRRSSMTPLLDSRRKNSYTYASRGESLPDMLPSPNDSSMSKFKNKRRSVQHALLFVRRDSNKSGTLQPSSATYKRRGTIFNFVRASRALTDSGEKLVKRRQLLGKFKRAVRITVFCANTFKEHCLRINENKDELAPYIQRLHFHEDDTPDLLIDLSKFKANRQLRIPDETKRILSKEFEERTPQEVYTVTIALRNIRSFAEYPKRMQQKIAEVGLYEKYESKRVIVRQGHPASAFYFILSGGVVVMVMDEETSYARPVAHLYKGQTFGELAIVNGTKRNSTVIAKETCEFLSISARDYHRIFMAGGVKDISDPDQETFLKGLNCLSGWPIQKLQENPNKCQFLYFKDADVIIRDSEFSDWLIIVKSGSIQVLKKLKKVTAYEWKKKKKIEPLLEREERDYALRRMEWRRILPELGIPLKHGTDVSNTKFLSNGKPVPFEHPEDEEDEETEDEDEEELLARKQKESRRKQQIPSLWPLSVDISGVKNGQYLKDETIPSYKQQVTKSNSQAMEAVTSTVTKTHKPVERSKSERVAESTRSARRKNRSHSIIAEEEQELMGYQPHIRTIMEDIDGGGVNRKDDVMPEDLNPEFVHVQTLTKGQVFGLSDLMIGPQPSFSVISKGADCILINKAFYEEQAPEKLLREMRQELCPYPTEEELQQRLQVSVDWQAYRKVTLNDSMYNVNAKKCLRLTTYGRKTQEAF